MKNFEIFERIINGDLRPHKYESDGKELEEKLKNLRIPIEDIEKYKKYAEEKGIYYRIKIKDSKTGEIIRDEESNYEFNALIDLTIPPLPVKEGEKYYDFNATKDKKAEIYHDLIEFEYARNLISIDEYYNNNTKKKIKEYAYRTINKLKKLWKDIRLYKKLIIKGKELNWEKCNDYIIYILKEYIDRIFYYILEVFRPYVKDEFWEETIALLNSEKMEEMKILREAESNNLAKEYKEETGLNLPWTINLFETERKRISKLKNIKKRILIYKEYLTFWKRTILTNNILYQNEYIIKTIIPLIENEIKNLEYKIRVSPEKENEIETKKIDQDSLIDKFKKECERRKLEKGKTIPINILYEIAKKIGMKVGKIENFKTGERNYQILRQYASLLKYKRKRPHER